MAQLLNDAFNLLILGRRNFRHNSVLIVTGDRTSSDDCRTKIHQDRQSVLDGLRSLFPSLRQLCDLIDEANWMASGSFSVLFRLTWCIMSRKLSIDQFTLFNYSLSYLIIFLVYCFPLLENARNVNFYDKFEISILLSPIAVPY